ncbi:hypothetical protein P3S68_014772 [Capsicum galapagoense]
MKNTLGKKMVIEIPACNRRPVKAVQSSKLSNKLGITARNFLTLSNKWKELTKEEKYVALIRCHEKFEINLDEHYIKDSCEDILKNRSRQWRYKLKKMLESARSEEASRKIEVPELTPENWNRLCDMWSDPEHKTQCQINKINRSKLKCNHIMGSKAFVVAHAEINMKGWNQTELTSTKSLITRLKKNSINDLKDLYTSGEPSMTIDEIMDVVLGKKSEYIKGLGYGSKPDTTRATQRIAAELEDSFKKVKKEAATVQHDLQKTIRCS